MRLSIVVPTLNPGPFWEPFTAALLLNLEDLALPRSRVLVIDSCSADRIQEKARRAGFRAMSIDRASFDHGGTRQMAVEREANAEFLLFLTQDAILARPDSVRTLMSAFADQTMGAVYGRQLPRQGAMGIEAHARLFNYPPQSRVRSMDDARSLGFKSIFSSNAFCAFRRSALTAVGGFSRHAIASEETIAIAAMHMAGWRSAYVAEAAVYHSHAYSTAQEFSRYFDVGVTQARNPELVKIFGIAGGEGRRFVLSELRYLLRHRPWQVPAALLRTVTKLAGYRIGRNEARLSRAMCRRLSMNRGFWNAQEGGDVPAEKVVVAQLSSGGSRRVRPDGLQELDDSLLRLVHVREPNGFEGRATGGPTRAAGAD